MSRSLDDVAMQTSSALMLASKSMAVFLGSKDAVVLKRDTIKKYRSIMEDAAVVIDKLGMATEDEKKR